jgi:hypothetical protein
VYVNDAQVVACAHRKMIVQSMRNGPGVRIRVAMAGES